MSRLQEFDDLFILEKPLVGRIKKGDFFGEKRDDSLASEIDFFGSHVRLEVDKRKGNGSKIGLSQLSFNLSDEFDLVEFLAVLTRVDDNFSLNKFDGWFNGRLMKLSSQRGDLLLESGFVKSKRDGVGYSQEAR